MIIACHHMPTWWVACNFSHIYSLWISWRGMRLSHPSVFHMSKPVWCMVPEISSATDIFFFVILGYVLPFYSPINPENQNFEKIKKNPGDIILHMSTINQNSMMYDSWDIYGVQQTEFFLILNHFLPFNPTPLILNNPKNQNFEKNEKNPWRYHHFTQVYHKWQSYIWFLRYQLQQTDFRVSRSGVGGMPPILQFFFKPPHQNWCPPWGAFPPSEK